MKTRSFLLFVALSSLFAACKPIVHGGGTGATGGAGGSSSTGFGGSTCDGYMGGNGGTGGTTYDPCAGLSCGDACSPCDPTQGPCALEIPDNLFCDANGQCSAGVPACGPEVCSSDSDCIYNGPCNLCPDGTTACPIATCINSQCVLSDSPCAPPPPPACTTDSDCLTPAQDELCELCPDGSTVCAENACVDGVCQSVTPPCPGTGG